MPSIFGHALAGYTIGLAFNQGTSERRTRLLAMACAMAPDLDWLTAFLDPQDHFGLSHRGILHSLLAGGIITCLAMLLGNRSQLKRAKPWLCLGVATFSHGLLDAFTFGGTGVSFLAPFSKARFVSLWQPIFVSPIPLSDRLTEWLLFSLGTELFFIGLPSLVVMLGVWRLRRSKNAEASGRLGVEAPD